MTMTPPLPDQDALTLSRAIRERRVSCAEVMRAYLDRIGRLNPQVNAIVSLRDPDALMAEARSRDEDVAAGRPLGPLHGFPQAIKDLTAAAGLPTTFGSPIYANNVPTADAIMVERMKAAGAIVIGKTNVPEFGLGSQTYNTVFGATRNAYDQRLTSGGSSGGAAVAVALGMLPVADGSDHGGSLRNPAAYNNIFGLRPTGGLVPATSDEVFLPSLTVPGPMARTVPDLAMLLSVQAGYDARVPTSMRSDPSALAAPLTADIGGRRIGWLGDLGKLAIEPGILDLCEGALRAMEGAGAIVEPARIDFDVERMFQTWMDLRAWAFAGARRDIYENPATRSQMKPEAQWEVERGLTLSALDVFAASRMRSAWYEAVRRLFDRFDALALPGAQAFPFGLGTPWPRTIAGRSMDTYHRWMEVMIPFTMANCPAISVPVGFGPAGQPMGMQLAGPSGGELALLRLAHGYDEATGWTRRHRPAILAAV